VRSGSGKKQPTINPKKNYSVQQQKKWIMMNPSDVE
jgi:hypothetical protein